MITLPDRILCLVTDVERAGGEDGLLDIVSDAVRGGVNMVQVRAPQLGPSELEQLARAVVSAVGDDALVVVNGPIEVARKANAAGVHFKDGNTLNRSSIPDGLLAGQSVHTVQGAVHAEDSGADYLVAGTIFSSASHPGGPTGGVEFVRAVCARVSIPVVAIGGITEKNAGIVMQAGASGVAVIGAIISSPDPLHSAKSLAAITGSAA